MEAVTKDRDLDQLARLWISGESIQWELLYDEQKPQKISLPLYPFEKERHWIEIPNGNPYSKQSLKSTPAVKIESDQVIYHSPEIKWTTDELLSKVTDTLRNLVGDVLQLNPERIDLDESLTDFGFDSVTLKELADRLSQRFSILIAPSIFLNKANLKALLIRWFVTMPRTACPLYK